MNYIPADKLIAFKETLADIIVSSQGLCTYDACKERAEQETPVLLSIIASLQQEQPEVDFVNTDNRIQYASIEDGIKAHAETYSFNIESQLSPQLTKEQQALWRKEIEQACISGGEAGVELAKDMRYKENQHPEVDLNEEVERFAKECGYPSAATIDFQFAYHFYELGGNARKEE